MSTESRTKLSGILSLAVGLILLFGLMAYGVTTEVPVGGVDGTLLMEENGKPLPNAYITFSTPSAPEDIPAERWVRTDKNGNFRLDNLLAGTYKVDVSTKAHKLEGHFETVHEGKHAERITLKAKPITPYLEMYASQRVFLPSEPSKVQVK